MGPSQICGCPFREPRVFEMALLYIYIIYWHIFIDLSLSQTSRDCTCQGDHQKVLESQCAELRKLWRPDGKGGICSLIQMKWWIQGMDLGADMGRQFSEAKSAQRQNVNALQLYFRFAFTVQPPTELWKKGVIYRFRPSITGKKYVVPYLCVSYVSIIHGTRPWIRSLTAF